MVPVKVVPPIYPERVPVSIEQPHGQGEPVFNISFYYNNGEEVPREVAPVPIPPTPHLKFRPARNVRPARVLGRVRRDASLIR